MSTAVRARDVCRSFSREPAEQAIVQQLVDGNLTGPLPTAVELQEAIDRLDRRGWSAAEISQHLRCAERTVVRQRARRRNRA